MTYDPLADLAATRRDLMSMVRAIRHDIDDPSWGNKYARRNHEADTLNQMAAALAGVERALAGLAARRDALLAVVRGLEWSREHAEDGEPLCPTCGGFRWIGHAPNCSLAAALAMAAQSEEPTR